MLRTGELFDQLTLRLPLEAYRPLLQCHTLVNGEFVEKVEAFRRHGYEPVSYTHLRAHETVLDLVCRLLLEKKKNT